MASGSLSPNKKEGDPKSGRRSPILLLASRAIDSIEPYFKRFQEGGGIIRKQRELLQPLLVNRFHYSPLPNRTSWIRLLKLEPGESGEMIRCSLHPVNLDERPKYTAFSYSWRKDMDWVDVSSLTAQNIWSSLKDDGRDVWTEKRGESTRPIYCGGKNLGIYPNLHNALLQLRRTRPGYYWIDAICINQSDTEELNSQVQMMGRIYHSAELVTVWLGTCPSFLSPGIKQLEAIADKDISEIDTGPKNVRPLRRPFGDTTLGKTMAAAAYLLSRRWFRRIWVLQEVFLARDISFYLGEHRISEKVLIAAAEWGDPQRNKSLTEPQWSLMSEYLPLITGYMRYVPFLLNSRTHFLRGGQVTLEDSLRMCEGRQAEDVRDYIYSGLGLIQPDTLSIDRSVQLEDPTSDTNASPATRRRLWSVIRADYTADLFEILLNVAGSLLSWPSADRLLSVASQTHDPEQNTGEYRLRPGKYLSWLPSWFPIPGWSFYSQGLQDQSRFAASTQPASDHRVSADGTTLFLQAARLGTVEEHGMQVALVVGEGDVARFVDFARGLPRQYAPTGQCSLAVLANVLVSGLWREREPQRSAVKGLCHLLEDLIRRNNTKGLTGRSLRKSYGSLKAAYPHQPWPEPGEDPVPMAWLYANKIHSVLKFQNILYTKEGHLASGPTWLKRGDVLMLVKGARVPYIFTPVDNCLKRKISERTKLIKSAKTKHERKGELEAEVREIEQRIGNSDGWVLVGEGYVEGLMNGEGELGDNVYDRIKVV